MSETEYTDNRGRRFVAQDNPAMNCDGCAHHSDGDERDADCLAAPACGNLRSDGRSVVWVRREK
jgi:hypothetical protein